MGPRETLVPRAEKKVNVHTQDAYRWKEDFFLITTSIRNIYQKARIWAQEFFPGINKSAAESAGERLAAKRTVWRALRRSHCTQKGRKKVHVLLPQTGDRPHDGDVTSHDEHVANFSGKSRAAGKRSSHARWPTKMATTASGTTNDTALHKQLLVATQFSTPTTWAFKRCLKVGITALQLDENTPLPPDLASIPENHLPTASQPPPSHERIFSTPLIKKIIGIVFSTSISAPYRLKILKQNPTDACNPKIHQATTPQRIIASTPTLHHL